MITNYRHNNSFVLVVAMLLAILLMVTAAQGQTGFTYQGRLTDGGTAANGNYDLQFALWDSLTGGAQVGSTQSLNTVAVSNGVFTVTLDFGANAFPGASRFLEISARPSAGGSFTLLSPRQPITPTPYAIRSLNASSADSVPASGVSAGSGNYIQNSSSPQASSNFNISGNGNANSFSVKTGSIHTFQDPDLAIANWAGGDILFFTGTPAVQTGRMTITSAGNVGIGGFGQGTPQRRMHIRDTGSGGVGVGDLLVTGTGTVGSAITLEATGGDGRSFSWISTASSASSGGGKLAAFDVTAGAYRMVIDSTGRVGIGTTAPDQSLSVSGNASKSSGGTSWAVFSDERLKNIKGPFTPGLKTLLQLQPLRYEYKPNNSLGLPGGSDEVGFIAQAVQQVLPEAVRRTQQGYLQLHSDPILWTMLNAIKEQQAQIARLQQVNSTLNTRLHEVEKALRKESFATRRR